jgi:hypothetical protein
MNCHHLQVVEKRKKEGRALAQIKHTPPDYSKESQSHFSYQLTFPRTTMAPNTEIRFYSKIY